MLAETLECKYTASRRVLLKVNRINECFAHRISSIICQFYNNFLFYAVLYDLLCNYEFVIAVIVYMWME